MRAEENHDPPEIQEMEAALDGMSLWQGLGVFGSHLMRRLIFGADAADSWLRWRLIGSRP